MSEHDPVWQNGEDVQRLENALLDGPVAPDTRRMLLRRASGVLAVGGTGALLAACGSSGSSTSSTTSAAATSSAATAPSANEAQHLALARFAAGKLPDDQGFQAYPITNIGGVVAALEKAGVGFGKPGAKPGKFYSFSPPPAGAVVAIGADSPK